MKKETLASILKGRIFDVPDYQRGYAWESDQWKDFVSDIDAMIDDGVTSHYTGTIVIFQKPEKPTESYGAETLEMVDVVDGQQRLTTCSIYLSLILRKLVAISEDNFNESIPMYLFSGSKTKLKLNNDTADFYTDLVSKGVSNIEANSVHQNRIKEAYQFLKKHIEEQLKLRPGKEEYLKNLFEAITEKMNFSFYQIEVESEIGMTFELMNSRGKDLSTMELLKNYLMYWVYRNIQIGPEKDDFTKIINKAWKEVYVNIAKGGGNENQCLNIAWILLVNHSRKSWQGYNGFKADHVIPLRNFEHKSKEEVKRFILQFVDELALISKHYSAINIPNDGSSQSTEFQLLTKIKNMGNIANYLPLIVAARIKCENNEGLRDEYLELLKSIESFSYRVFLWEGKRSNAGQSSFYRWADEIYSSKYPMISVTLWIYQTINWYSPENAFRKSIKEDYFNWYHNKRLLKYTLFEYELFLLDGKNPPKLKWEALKDSSIEHILPQTPGVDSYWLSVWTDDERNKFLNDIGNLVLTKDNSRYSNFEFARKKGTAGSGYCYSNSDIRQERNIAEFDDWTPLNLGKRRESITNWIIDNWGIAQNLHEPLVDFVEDEEDYLLDDIDL